MKTITVPVVEEILSANDHLAAQNRRILDEAGVFAINIMSSPGAGKTSTIVATQNLLKGRVRLGMINGDIATTIDADRAAAVGVQALQINTGGTCHLDAVMLSTALKEIDLSNIDLLIVENVGNLICPSNFKLGTHLSVVIASVPEGDDKPYKYPTMYRGVQAMIVNKIDVLPYFNFNMEHFIKGVEVLNPGLTTFKTSCTTGEGQQEWADWLVAQVQANKERLAAQA
jgi:hydrogenase nickel incorporation protein HypB